MDNLKRYNFLLGELNSVYHEASRKLGMSDSVSKILYAVCFDGGSCSITALCRNTGLIKQTVNSALRSLEKEGLTRLVAVDGKSKMVVLTDKGTDYSLNTACKIIDAENSVLNGWTKEEVNIYLSLTEKFIAQLKERMSDF